jgi:hypothetical protein
VRATETAMPALVDVTEAPHPPPVCGYHDDARFGNVHAIVQWDPVSKAWAASGVRNARLTGRVS